MAAPVPEPSLCLPPVVDAGIRLLVLGSLPGVQSLRAAQYYAHPRNGFWPLLEGIVGEPLAELEYYARLERLLSRGIGLWDVVAEARRPGSLDAAMRGIAANPLIDLIARLPRLEAIAFNGATSARIGRRTLGQTPLTLINLPSSSAALTLSIAQKAERWAALKQFVDRPSAPEAAYGA